MHFSFTKGLSQALKLKLSYTAETLDPFKHWICTFYEYRRRKVIIAVHEPSGFVVLINGIKPKDYPRVGELLLKAIIGSMTRYGIKPDVIERFVEGPAALTLSLSSDPQKTLIASTAKRDLGFDEVKYDMHNGADTLLNAMAGFKPKFQENQRNTLFMASLQEAYGKELFETVGLDLSVRLDLGDYVAERRFVVPLAFNFAQLNYVIQALFSWQNCHLYNFELKYEIGKSILYFPYEDKIFGDDWHEMNGLIKPEERLSFQYTLAGLLTAPQSIKYEYDFGDSWTHAISVNGVVKDYNKREVTFVSGFGDAALEDSGGPSGFARLRRILADPKDEEHDSMVEWVGPQWHALCAYELSKMQRRAGSFRLGEPVGPYRYPLRENRYLIY